MYIAWSCFEFHSLYDNKIRSELNFIAILDKKPTNYSNILSNGNDGVKGVSQSLI